MIYLKKHGFFDTGIGTEAAISFTLQVDLIRILKKQRHL
jgi:hypothetical protein